MINMKSLFSIKRYIHISKRLFIEPFEEPIHMVDSEPFLNPKNIQISYFKEEIKEEMYQLYLKDPIENNIKTLAQKYNATEIRIKAILLLLSKRKEKFKELQVENISPEWNDIYMKSLQASFDINQLAQEYNKPLNEIETIIANMQEHTHRLEFMKAMIQNVENSIEDFSQLGVDTKFREIPPTSKLATSYEPKLFGDDAYEKEVKDLYRRIENETKAQLKPHHGLVFLSKYLDEKDGKKVIDYEANVKATPLQSDYELDIIHKKQMEIKSKQNNDKPIESLYKYAFIDLALPKESRKTMIRTRSGE